MAAREELIGRIAGLAEAFSASAQFIPRDFLMESDLTLPQFRVLYMLASRPSRITDLAQALGMAPANASSMVERLVRKGLVVRDPHPSDRRAALANLTDRGRDVVEGMVRSESSVINKVAVVLPDEELEMIAHALELLNRGTERLVAANGDDVAAQGDDR